MFEYLNQKSIEICQLNNCTEENHNCESYAYFNISNEDNILEDIQLLSICSSDYFQGNSGTTYILPLPCELSSENDFKKELETYNW